MKSDIIPMLEELSKKELAYESDDFNPMSNYGGNYDDAYWGGYKDGRASLAKDLLDFMRYEEEKENG